jgi:exopolysaccharide biosynthesis WecB/TagA/CpsF family protein
LRVFNHESMATLCPVLALPPSCALWQTIVMRFPTVSGPIEVNVNDWQTLASQVRSCLSERRGIAIATLNLDHLSKLRTDRRFARAYRDHDLITADGNPVVWTCGLAGQEVELLPGADCILPLGVIAKELGVRVALLGSTEESLQGATRVFHDVAPGIDISHRIAPPMGFDPEGEDASRLLSKLDSDGVGLCFIALGAPKQEILAVRGRELAPSIVFMSIGAGLDFLAGLQLRAPLWVRRLALEWLWRVAMEPRRLLGRYFRSALILPGLVVRALFHRVAG